MDAITSSLYSQNLSSYFTNTDSDADDLFSIAGNQTAANTAGGSYFKSKAEIRKQVESALSLVTPGKTGKITMADITASRDSRLAEFKDTVSKGLLAVGVDPKVDFTLGYNSSTGKLIVNTTSSDKRKIEAYFAANPDLAEEFNSVQKLDAMANMIGKMSSSANQSAQALLSQLNDSGLGRSIAVQFADSKANILAGVNTTA
jgi:hypothetical protein